MSQVIGTPPEIGLQMLLESYIEFLWQEYLEEQAALACADGEIVAHELMEVRTFEHEK